MDIRKATDKEKQLFFEQAAQFYPSIRNAINTLEKDIKSEDLQIQASAVWITGQMANWYADFLSAVRNMQLKKDEIEKQMIEANSDKENKTDD